MHEFFWQLQVWTRHNSKINKSKYYFNLYLPKFEQGLKFTYPFAAGGGVWIMVLNIKEEEWRLIVR